MDNRIRNIELALRDAITSRNQADYSAVLKLIKYAIKYAETGNRIVDSDSYKASHWGQYPKKTTGTHSYLEARGSDLGYEDSIFFGLQYILKKYFATPITADEVYEAQTLIEPHGEPFNLDGWMHIVNDHGGNLPLRIRAVPEGTIVPIKNVLMTVETTCDKCYWVASYFETALMRVWYPITVATQSYYIKKTIKHYLDLTADDPEGEIGFKLHDFGSRGVSSKESAGIGGLAHLINFRGTDTMHALEIGRDYYHEPTAGFSIPAGEHSTFSSWGREGETEAYRNMLKTFGGKYPLIAVVSDTWNIYNAVGHIWGEELKQEVIDSGSTVVIRPDSGVPVEILCGKGIQSIDATDFDDFKSTVADILHEILQDETPHGEYGGDITQTFLWQGDAYKCNYKPDWNRHDKQYYFIENCGSMESKLTCEQVEYTDADKGIFQLIAEKFGFTTNAKGFKVFNTVKVLQGDGVNPDSIKLILETMHKQKWSASNIAFGMGGALLQKVDRDTLKMAYKCSSAVIDGVETDVYKDPITDSGKTSKKGRLDLVKSATDTFFTVKIDDLVSQNYQSELITYFENGETFVDETFENIRKRATLTETKKYDTIGK